MNMYKKYSFVKFLFVVLLAVLVGCSSQGESELQQEEIEQEEIEEETVGADFPVTVTDDVGREVTIDAEPESIISIQASNTEILFALGVGDRLIGVSEYCNYPEEALSIQTVGAQDMDAELVLSLLPDIVFVTEYHYNNHEDILHQYEEAGMDVVVTGSANSFDEVYNTIELIATATGSTDEAEQLIASMQESLDEIKEKAETITDKKRVWVEVAPAPDIFTTGKDTFMHEMLESIQAINVAEEEVGWVKLTEEEIVQYDPDVIITTYGYYVDEPESEVLTREGWAEIPAVKNGQVFDVDNDTVNRPGPRLIEGVETLATLIYPEVFE